MELFQAHQQWATRPDDQRFQTVRALREACKAYADVAIEREGVRVGSLRVENVDGDVQLIGKGNQPARLTYWAFGQLCGLVKAPASYLRDQPATLACQNLNHDLARRVATYGQDATVSMLFHTNGSLLCRSMNSDKYSRFWNWEVADRLLALEARGWEPARPDMNQRDDKLPLYASDHDLFAFMRHSQRTINEPGNPDGLRRGLIATNSEVGAGKLKLVRFLYRAMCGNHIIWGASKVVEIGLVHVGKIREKVYQWDAEVRRYMDESASEDEAQIAAAKRMVIAGTKDEVLDKLFGIKAIDLSRKSLEMGYDSVVRDQDGDPRTVWGIVQGLTRASQQTPYADERMKVDRAAGRIMAEAF